MKRTKTGLAICMLMGLAISSNADVIIVDDFTSTSTHNETRLRHDDAGTGWIKNASSDWAISGGTLSNAGTVTNAISSESAVGQVVDASGLAGDQVVISFDYTVDAGSTLYFALMGYKTNGSPAGNGEILANTGTLNANIQGDKGEADFGDINLIDGTDAVNTPVLTFTGTGTYSLTVDLTTYAWHADELPGLSGSLTDVSDFDLIMAVFASDVETAGAMTTIDNLSITSIPEPATLGLIAAFGGSLLFIRRLIQM